MEYNNTLAFYGRKLKHASLINSTYTLNDTVHFDELLVKGIKVFHISNLLVFYPNCKFPNNDGDVLVDAPGDTSN